MTTIRAGFSLIGLLTLSACGGGSGSESGNAGPIPTEIQVSVSLPDDFNVQKGEEFTIEARSEFTPFHPSIEITYSWTKIVFPKPLDELLADFGGDTLSAILSLESDPQFSSSATINDFAPELEPGGFVQYTVTVGAEGFQFDTSTTDPNSLNPVISNTTDVIRVFVTENTGTPQI